MYSDTVRLLSQNARLDDHERCQIVLFATWIEINDVDLDAVDLDAYQMWLIGWGIPTRGAELHVEAIKRRLAALERIPDDD